jgi:hypothetical protein
MCVEQTANYGKLPLLFEPNEGQSPSEVKFLSRGKGYRLLLMSNEVVLQLGTRIQRPSPAKAGGGNLNFANLRMKLIGSQSRVGPVGLEKQTTRINYYSGNDPSRWREGIPTFDKVRYANVYSGIDLVYYGNQRQLEYDFVVAPGANPDRIVLSFEAADGQTSLPTSASTSKAIC